MKKSLLAAALVIALAITSLLACSSKDEDAETKAAQNSVKEEEALKDDPE